jgi:hypothetical protein
MGRSRVRTVSITTHLEDKRRDLEGCNIVENNG